MWEKKKILFIQHFLIFPQCFKKVSILAVWIFSTFYNGSVHLFSLCNPSPQYLNFEEEFFWKHCEKKRKCCAFVHVCKVLTLYHTIPRFNDIKRSFQKHCGKRRKCHFCTHMRGDAPCLYWTSPFNVPLTLYHTISSFGDTVKDGFWKTLWEKEKMLWFCMCV